MTIRRIEPTPQFHRAVTHNGLIYLSGIVARDGEADMATQTEQVLDRLNEVLLLSASNLDSLLSVTIFVTDMADKPAMNDVWRRRLRVEAMPARSTICVSDLDGPYRIEISAVAAVA